METLQEAIDLYARAEDLRWHGDTDGARVFIKQAIKRANVALDHAREPLLCRQVIGLLTMCVQMSDGLGAGRR
jgi:hypothetical protein